MLSCVVAFISEFHWETMNMLNTIFRTVLSRETVSVYVIAVHLFHTYSVWGHKDGQDMPFSAQVAHCLCGREAETYLLWICHGQQYFRTVIKIVKNTENKFISLFWSKVV